MTLVRRAVDRRLAVQADSSLTSYRARAHGFLFFLAQVGEGLTQPPKLVKADQLEVEVYWQAPNHSKQVILALNSAVEVLKRGDTAGTHRELTEMLQSSAAYLSEIVSTTISGVWWSPV